MEKILTISVAAYNLENLISKNLDSFINCKNKDKLEVIVTDDGSTDNTANVVEEYTKKYPGIIRLIRQSNSGPGSTVNSGIKHAKGKYFKTVDGDDWVVSENLDYIIEELSKSNADMIITKYLIFGNIENDIIKECAAYLPENKVLLFEDYSKKLNLSMHEVMFKTKIIKKIKLDNCFYTDTEYLLLPLKYIKTFEYINRNMYVYLVGQANQSVNFKSMQKNIKMHNNVLNRLIDYYNENKDKISKNNRIYLCNKIASVAANQLGTYLSYEDKKVKKETIKKFNKSLKKRSIDIYYAYKRNKKSMLIIVSNYLLVNFVSYLYLKKYSKYRY